MNVDRWLLEKDLASIVVEPNEQAHVYEWIRAAQKTRPILFAGAGLSLNARPAPGSPPTTRVQNWRELVRSLADALRSESTGVDALQVAERYDQTFGRKQLWARIRAAVPDHHMQPGAVHRAIAECTCWHAILTLNYDTLIERAYRARRVPPFVVTSEGHWSAMTEQDHHIRIAHLHGHIEDDPARLVLTQEDFRKFADTRPITCTVVRQLLLQHPVLIVGISADDPNFILWAGWIRDHVGTVKAPWLRIEPAERGKGARELGFDAMWRSSFHTVTATYDEANQIDDRLAKLVSMICGQLPHEPSRLSTYLDSVLPAQLPFRSTGADTQPKDRPPEFAAPRPAVPDEARLLVDDLESVLSRAYNSPPQQSLHSEMSLIIKVLARVRQLVHPAEDPVLDGLSSQEVLFRKADRGRREEGPDKERASKIGNDDIPPPVGNDERIRRWHAIAGDLFLRVLLVAARLRSSTISLPRKGDLPSPALHVRTHRAVDALRSSSEAPRSPLFRPLTRDTLDWAIADVATSDLEHAARRWLNLHADAELPPDSLETLRHVRFVRGDEEDSDAVAPSSAQAHRRKGFIAVLHGQWARSREHYSEAVYASWNEGEPAAIQELTQKTFEVIDGTAKHSPFLPRDVTIDTTPSRGQALTQDLKYARHLQSSISSNEHGQDVGRKVDVAVTGHIIDDLRSVRRVLEEALLGNEVADRDGTRGVGEMIRYFERYWLWPTRAVSLAAFEGESLADADQWVEAVRLLTRYGHDDIISRRLRVLVSGPRRRPVPPELMAASAQVGRYPAEEDAHIAALTASVSEWTANADEIKTRLISAVGKLDGAHEQITTWTAEPLAVVAKCVGALSPYTAFDEFTTIWSGVDKVLTEKLRIDRGPISRDVLWNLPLMEWWKSAVSSDDRRRLGRLVEGVFALEHTTPLGGISETPANFFVHVAETQEALLAELHASFPGWSRYIREWAAGYDPANDTEYALFWLWVAVRRRVLGEQEPTDAAIETAAQRWLTIANEESQIDYRAFEWPGGPLRAAIEYIARPSDSTIRAIVGWVERVVGGLGTVADRSRHYSPHRSEAGELFGRALVYVFRFVDEAERMRLRTVLQTYLDVVPSGAEYVASLAPDLLGTVDGALASVITRALQDVVPHEVATRCGLDALLARTNAGGPIPDAWVHLAARLTSARDFWIANRACYVLARVATRFPTDPVRGEIVRGFTDGMRDGRARVVGAAIRNVLDSSLRDDSRLRPQIEALAQDRRLAVRAAHRLAQRS